MNTIGIIPARGGSKGIKNKNIKELLGKPLICYTIEEALLAQCFTSIVVTSDDPSILEIAKRYKGIDALHRPDQLATDTATSNQVIEHVLATRNFLNEVDQLCLLQPTSPLRTHRDIESSFKLFKTHNPDLLLSAYKPRIEIQKAFVKNEDGFLVGLLSAEAPFSRRQDLPEVLLPNGAIYICNVSNFKKNNCLPRSRIRYYEMSRDNSIDIDTLDDFSEVESILKQRSLQ